MPRGRSKADATDWLRRNRSQAKPSAARITSGAPRVLPLAHFFGEAPEPPWILKHDEAGRSLPGFTFAFSVSLGWIYPQIVAIEPSMLASSARDSGTYCGKDSIKTLWGLATFLSPSHCSGLALSGPPKWPSLSPPPTGISAFPVGDHPKSAAHRHKPDSLNTWQDARPRCDRSLRGQSVKSGLCSDCHKIG